jgi:hypothetical protein
MKLSAKVIKPSLNEIELRLEICFINPAIK